MKIEIEEKELNDLKAYRDFYRTQWHKSSDLASELWDRLGLMAIKTPEFEAWYQELLLKQKAHKLLNRQNDLKSSEVVPFFLHNKSIDDTLFALSSWEGH